MGNDNFIGIILGILAVLAFGGALAYFAAPPLQPFKTWINPNQLIDACTKRQQFRVNEHNAINCTLK